MRVYWEGLFTKAQILNYIASQGVNEPLPKKGKSLWIVPPIAIGSVSRITKTALKGSDNRLLFRLELLSN